MSDFKLPAFFQSRAGRQLLRAAGCVVVLTLILVSAYLAASKRPGFYRRFERVGEAERKKLGGEMIRQTLDCYSQIQESKSGVWTLRITDKQLNGWLTSDGAPYLSRALPREVKNPRIAIHGDRFELAAQVRYGLFSGVVCLVGSIRAPESGKIALRIRSAKLGVYPFDKNKLTEILKKALNQPDWNLEQSTDGGDPVLIFRPNIVIEKKFSLILESVQTNDAGQCQITGIRTFTAKSRSAAKKVSGYRFPIPVLVFNT
ncbi:MAG: hypothetical protein LBT05_00940 [Planctomycetaceae bacterium]|jgi:hypothetical protein|nr:hypothetical protein [Planctomycetaceae bacterium]